MVFYTITRNVGISFNLLSYIICIYISIYVFNSESGISLGTDQKLKFTACWRRKYKPCLPSDIFFNLHIDFKELYIIESFLSSALQLRMNALTYFHICSTESADSMTYFLSWM
jgi:hypothetical protein